ncbi:MAG: hypothetical protein ACRDH0_04880 [Actinomycetota bacterium]
MERPGRSDVVITCGLVLDFDLRSKFEVTVAAPAHVPESAKQETVERGTPDDHRPGARGGCR